MKKIIKNIFRPFAFTLFISCAGTGDLKAGAPGAAKIYIKDRKYSEVWDAALKVVNLQFKIDTSNKETGVIKAHKSASAFSWGEVVGVFIIPEKESEGYTIEVQSLQRYRVQFQKNDWSQGLLQSIKTELKLP